MILRIWSRIFLMLLLVILPLMSVQYWLQKESVELVFDVSERTGPAGFLDSHLESLKRLSKLDPENTEKYRKEFEKTAEARIARADIQLVRENLVRDLLKQTLRNALVVLLLSLVFSFGIARSIVGYFRRLLDENRRQSSRLERLGSLESWQRVARMVVHELRAPITPIKLVATDIESRYRALEPGAFARHLATGAELIRSQVAAIERMSESFTRFARLPEVSRTPVSLPGLLRKFVDSHRDYRPGLLKLELGTPRLAREQVPVDPELLNQLFFNLLKNACEANPGHPITVTLSARQSAEKTWIELANSGALIPEGVAARIFELYVSTKAGAETANLGLGLTISKKIALDHGGDLCLARNNERDGVVFELELPNL